MRIAVLGDSHGNTECIDVFMKNIGDVDYIIHTGDNFADIEYIAENYAVNIIGVKGNCDFQSKGKNELLEVIGGKKFFVTHGHQYAVKYGLNNIFYRGKELEADVVVFGHSHIPHYSLEEDMILLNPGSISLPRGGSSKGFAILDVNKDITVEFVEI
ncbi:hypothetical protein SAMN05660472_00443 [Natronincola ferrireducens]|uniref:Phosphoesterase n=1 Tax=Natronincola ferrireducens TaxID=393762 RepID=A0A1G8Y732_9FIRM|nr:metallophosphoesterase [Natronincola ferrireducens]SDJ98523.1 hypothetical protein SAMN05660472_00443 [Natronincola ferrireducens]